MILWSNLFDDLWKASQPRQNWTFTALIKWKCINTYFPHSIQQTRSPFEAKLKGGANLWQAGLEFLFTQKISGVFWNYLWRSLLARVAPPWLAWWNQFVALRANLAVFGRIDLPCLGAPPPWQPFISKHWPADQQWNGERKVQTLICIYLLHQQKVEVL